MLKLTVHSFGMGTCALTGHEQEGLSVSFQDEPACFLGKKSFWQILSMRAAQARIKPEQKSAAVPVGNGAPVVK